MKNCNKNKRVAMFPGTFDPFTIGHESIVLRALTLFDEVVVAVVNNNEKKSFMSLDNRMRYIESVFENNPRVRVLAFDGLLVDVAKAENVDCLIRGVRTVQDFEYEKNLSDIYRVTGGIESVLLCSYPEYGFISSTMVRAHIIHGYDVSAYMPAKGDRSLLPKGNK
jgi:pantetheine-phosphate adenylyltransferase